MVLRYKKGTSFISICHREKNLLRFKPAYQMFHHLSYLKYFNKTNKNPDQTTKQYFVSSHCLESDK